MLTMLLTKSQVRKLDLSSKCLLKWRRIKQIRTREDQLKQIRLLFQVVMKPD